MGVLLVLALGCDDDDLPDYAGDLMGIPPGSGTDRGAPPDAGVDDGGVDGGLPVCATVEPGGPTNQVIFDDPTIEFQPRTAYARFRDCVEPARLLLVLTEDPSCGAGARELRVDLPATSVNGQLFDLAVGDDVELSFRDSDGTEFSNTAGCSVSTGSIRLDAFDLTSAGNQQRAVIEGAQLFDCRVEARAPIFVSGDITAFLERTFEEACPSEL